MRDVYDYLYEKALILKGSETSSRLPADLVSWLAPLRRGFGHRSLAAQSLGTLQSANPALTGSITDRLTGMWSDFARDFLSGQIPATGDHAGLSLLERPPTSFHKLVAEWICTDKAVAVSVNFDGLTRKAVRERLNSTDAKCVILSSGAHVENFFLRDHSSTPLFPVIKVWGDVFHATCKRDGCPEAGQQLPVYDISYERGDALACPECGQPRALQIYFPGYQQKEQDTEAIIDGLQRFVWQRIGLVIIAGLSGVWDSLLLRALATLGREMQTQQHLGNSSMPCVHVIDPDNSCYSVSELRRNNVAVMHHCVDVQEIAATTKPRSDRTPQWSTDVEFKTDEITAEEQFWKELWKRGSRSGYAQLPAGYRAVVDHEYLQPFRRLRQLGLKTRLLRREESRHNRRAHSLGAAHLAMYWIPALLDDQGSVPGFSHTSLASLAFLACAHHDLGHLPYTHLAEEVFDELHWTTHEWSEGFRHDEAIFATSFSSLRDEATATIARVAVELSVSTEDVIDIVNRAVEGRSGIPLLDAVVNSPLDADKIDYVFRDCHELGQSVRLPVKRRCEWFEAFVKDRQILLPSGMIGISGVAGEYARDLIEERWWLYKNMYLRPGYRVVERIARGVVMLWLTHRVPEVVGRRLQREADGIGTVDLRDVRALKGQAARDLLWKRLVGLDAGGGEPELVMALASELLDDGNRLGLASTCREWLAAAQCLLEQVFDFPEADDGRSYEQMVRRLSEHATWSGRTYVAIEDYDTIRDQIVRDIEYTAAGGPVVDIAVLPRMLAYSRPQGGRFGADGGGVSESWAVPSRDPERWGRKTGKWIPLSESAYGARDAMRWCQLIVLSPFGDCDPKVRHAENRLRTKCKEYGIRIYEEDPDEFWRDQQTAAI